MQCHARQAAGNDDGLLAGNDVRPQINVASLELAVLDMRPSRIQPFMEAAEFFADRRDADNLDRTLAEARRTNSRDPRLDFYQAVALMLRRADRPTAERLLTSYIANVPERSDYPSHKTAKEWLNSGK